MPVLKMLATVASPDFIACAGDILEVPGPLAKRLLAMRTATADGGGMPACEVISDPKKMAKAKKIHLCKDAGPEWEDDDD